MAGLKDSGKREKFNTGAVRDINGGKGRFDLNPPFAELFLARIMEDGAIKYKDRNWERGIPIGRFIESAERHIKKYKAGLRDEPHLSQAFWNIACALQTAAWVYLGLRPKELFNLPNHVSVGPASPLSEHEAASLRTFLGLPLGKKIKRRSR